MNEHLPVPRFFVEEIAGPLRYTVDPDVVPDQLSQPEPCPSSSIPSTQRNAESSWNSDLGDDAVFPTSASVPLLRHHQHMRVERVHSAPTLMEHEVGLALRNISDGFNDTYNQLRADRTRHASHPETNNHRSHGFIGSLMRPFSRRSRASSHEVDSPSALGAEVAHSPVMQLGGSGLSQHVSIQSVPEEDEEAVNMNSEASA